MNFKKYKRIFAFGCSFTRYAWPTWADLISSESDPDAEYHNYGRNGMGNIGISVKISEANNFYKFNEDDLIMIMWSTFCREDRWVDGDWLSQGNVYNSYPNDFLKKYADPMGYLIRDHGIISMANTYVKSLKCDSIILRSTPFSITEFEEETEHKLKQLMLYKMHQTEYDKLPKTLYEFFGNHWHSGELVKYFENWSSNKQEHFMRDDNHPRTTVYANYLESIGIKLSEKTHQLAKESDRILALSDTKLKLIENFKWIDPQHRPYFRILS